MITVVFNCHHCERCNQCSVEVREREPNESIVSWMNSVVRPAVRKEHNLRSRDCQESDIDVAVPTYADAPYGMTMWAVQDNKPIRPM